MHELPSSQAAWTRTQRARGAQRSQALEPLLLAIANRDRAAFQRFYEATCDLVWAASRRILQDSNMAEDCLVDVYLQVWQRHSSFDPERGTPRGWLMTITRARALDRLRERRRLRECSESEIPATPGRESDPFEHGSLCERDLLVRRCVASLTAEQREAVELSFLEGLAHTEIAARLGAPLGTIKGRIRRGLSNLREILELYRADLL